VFQEVKKVNSKGILKLCEAKKKVLALKWSRFLVGSISAVEGCVILPQKSSFVIIHQVFTSAVKHQNRPDPLSKNQNKDSAREVRETCCAGILKNFLLNYQFVNCDSPYIA